MKRVLFLIIALMACCIMATGALADPPANDDCADAYDFGTLTLGETVDYSGTITDATVDCDEYFMMSDVWVKFTLADTMNITIDFCSDTSMVYGTSRYLFAECPCNDDYYVDVRDNCTEGNAKYTWYSLPTGTYYYGIGGDDLMNESFTISVTGEEIVVPDNNNCANATAVGEVTDQEFTTIGGSYDGEGTCVSSSVANVWYVYTATFTGEALITINSDYSHKFAVYDGAVCSPLSTESDCTSDDEIYFDVVSGEQYLIEIGGRNSSAIGSGYMTIEEAPEHPDNDDCENATNAGTLTTGDAITLNGTVTNATNDCDYTDDAEVWIQFTLTSSMNVTIDFCSDWNSVMGGNRYLYDGCPCEDGTSYYYDESEECSNDNQSFTWYNLEAGTYYYPIIAEYLMAESYTVTITGEEVVVPDNDSCVNAIAVGEVTNQEFTTLGASFDGEGTCTSSSAPNVWYVYTPTFTGDARITISADFSDKTAVYDGDDCSTLPTELNCSSDSQLNFEVVAGQDYLIEIGGRYSDQEGSGTFSIFEAPEGPANDDCEDATDADILISGEPVTLTGTVADATNDCENLYNEEVWIKFTLADTMDVTIDFCSDWNTVRSASRTIYDECPCGMNYYYVDDMDECTNENPTYTWYGMPPGTYYYPIIADNLEEESYTITVTGTEVVPPDNDSCANATAINEVTELEYTTYNASLDGEGSCVYAANVWYVYTPTFTGEARAIVDAEYSDKFAVYDGADCSPLSTELECSSSGELYFDVTSGEQYLIEIGGSYSSAIGDGLLTVEEAPEGPANDDCEDATDAGTLSSNDTVTLTGTVTDATIDCDNHLDAEVWIKFTITGCMDVIIDYCDDSNDVMGSSRYLYDTCPCSGSYYVDDRSSCTNNNPSYTWYGLDAGTYYYPILVENLMEETYTINVTGNSCTVPDNDSCTNATAINEVTELEYTTYGASLDGEGSCVLGVNVWYVYTPTFTGEARITVDADYFNRYAVYNGGDCSPLSSEIICSGDDQEYFDVTAGEQYLIELGSSISNSSGDGLLTIEESPEHPANDDCANADDAGTLTSEETMTLTGTVEEATNDCELHSHDEVWVKFTLLDCMDVTIDFCDDDGNVDFGSYYLYTVCPCDDEDKIHYGYDAYCDNDNPSMTWYELGAGTYYYPIFEDDMEESTYSVNITGVDCPAAPEPDFVVTAPYSGTSTTCGAENDCNQITSSEDHIYEVTIPSTGTWTFSLCNSTSDSWSSYIFLDSIICNKDLGTDSQSCENGHAELTVEDLAAGTYYFAVTSVSGECGEYTLDITGSGTTYEYLPGDANMAAETWPAQTIGGDVTYLVNYFRGIADPCYLDGFYASADATGDCMVVGGDVTYLVNYFRGLADMSYCSNYEPAWPTPSDVPTDAPDGWPNCDASIILNETSNSSSSANH